MILDQLSIHAWIQNNQIKTESGQPLDFKTHRYLFDIYRDTSKYLCCIKAGQIGFSTMAILKTIWLAKNQKLDIAYILPTVEMVQKFVGSKVNRMAQQNTIIDSWMKDKDSITQKQVGQNYIHYLGAQTPTAAIMISADMLVADEYDKAPQNILEIFDSRLQHSKYGYKWVFSNPTIPDFGVDRFWNISDQKKWHITHACGENYIMDESCTDYQSEMYRCPKCKGEITDEERRMGEWVATAQGTWSGYWIPLWINPMIPASVICEHKKTKTAEYFHNFVAGLPYINPSDAISQSSLEKCLTTKVNLYPDKRAIIGIDTGYDLYYTIMNNEGIFHYGYQPSPLTKNDPNYDPYKAIENMLNEYPKWFVFADQGGDLQGVRKLQVKFPGRVFLVWSNREKKSKDPINWGNNDNIGTVSIDRNRVIQNFVEEINSQRVSFNGTREDWQDWFNHALNIYRVKEIKGEEGDPQYNWGWVWKRKGPDHWFMASVYARVGLDRYAGDMAQIIKKDNFMAGIETASNQDGSIGGRQVMRRMGSFNSNGAGEVDW